MPMMFNSQETQQESQQQERRYDPETLRKVTALATRLQHDHHETLTASQMEAIGLEVGLEPEFIHQAIAQLEEEHARMEQERKRQEEEEQQEEQLAEQRHKLHKNAVMTGTVQYTETVPTKSEFYSVCAALAVPMVFGFLAYYFKSGTLPGALGLYPRTGVMQMFTLVVPLPLALMQGFAVGKRRVGFVAAATLILALAPTVPFLSAFSPEQYQEILRDTWSHIPEMMLYMMMALPIAGALGVAGACIRQYYFPFAGRKSEAEGRQKPVQYKEYSVSRPEMVSLLSTMQSPHAPVMGQVMGQAPPQFYPHVQPSYTQAHPYGHAYPGMQTQPIHTHPQPAYVPIQQAASQQVQTSPYGQTRMTAPLVQQNARRTYVSVDVADLAELRQSATLVAVDYSFGQLRAWIEEIVRRCGGDLQAGSDGSLLTSFSTDAQAVRAARLMQECLPQFNQSLNRLPKPFRLRCGISAGESGATAPIARSQALLRTAGGGDTLVSSELGAAALAELGQLAPLPGSLMEDMAFVWRAEQPGTHPQPSSS